MNTKLTLKGPLIHRFSVRILILIFTVLVYWLLQFFLEDVASIQGPDYLVVENKYLSPQFTTDLERVNINIADNERSIERKREELALISDSSKNLQSTINQLIDLQRLSIQKQLVLSQIEQRNLSVSLAQFLETQKQYQNYNAELSKIIDRNRSLEAKKATIENQINQQIIPAKIEFEQLLANHQLRLAYLQLLILIPLLVASVFMLLKWRSSLYFPIFFGYGVAVFLKTGIVIHQYFPDRYAKYILLSVAIIAIVKMLAYFIQSIAFPKIHWLLKQYREAYESFLCPVCEYPIRTGPRKFLFWTRRTVNKVILPNEKYSEELYSCPSCGTQLFENCAECSQVRHSLLPYCQNCGNEKIR